MIKFCLRTLLVITITVALATSANAQPERSTDSRRRAEDVARVLFAPPATHADEDRRVASEAIEAVAVGTLPSPSGAQVLRVYYNRFKVGNRSSENIRALVEQLLVPLHWTVTVELLATNGIRPLGPPMGTATRADNKGCLVGTLGVVVTDASNRKRYITCNHVAAVDPRSLCPNAAKAKEVSLLQYPADCDAVVPVGTLLGPPPEIKDPPVYNDVDAALVEERGEGVDAKNNCGICPNGNWISPERAEADQTEINACGAASGLMTGKVQRDPAEVKLTYQPCGATAWFSGQLAVHGPFAVPGDSGAFAFDKDGAAVGLVFAGDAATVTFLNPAPTVLHALGDVKITPCVK
ncbi:MAG TPA: hypothetical protein VGQ65_01065 [Thermoanaerobaculia bacterium]|jgi:hypothetical protein|nr:hypothetical protein [Thermoanaerobaculia bacterium]